MKLSAAFHVPDGQGFPEVARRAASIGFAGVSLAFDPGWSDAELLDIRAAFDDQGVEIVELRCHCNFVTPRTAEARTNLKTLRRAMTAGAILNCDHAVTCAGSRGRDPNQPLAPHPDNGSDAAWEVLVHRAWEVLDRSEDLGIKLCFEPCATTTLNSLESLSDLCADLASMRVRIALNPAAIFNAKAAGDSRVALAEVFGELTDTIAVAHATDVALIEKGPTPVPAEAPLGEGVLDYATYLKLVAALELDTPVVVQPQPTDDAYRAALRYLAKAAPPTA
ncbi:sugar phosphate isomerase/epimerase [bacterium]|nr:sugar phosphate isomerase/epimerase [bacterium]